MATLGRRTGQLGQYVFSPDLVDSTDTDADGGLEYQAGTFCTVPVTGPVWDYTQPVLMWVVCENDFRGVADCSQARGLAIVDVFISYSNVMETAE